MKMRKNKLPHTLSDIACFLLLFTFISITFVFELLIILPDFHDTTGAVYKIYCLVGLFIVFNLKGNLVASMCADTSIHTTILKPPTKLNLRKYWHFCESCEVLVPPRSWHCQVCRTCILKRDHHCMFAGCCIGHLNHRYFIFVIIYLFIGTVFTTIYNSMYFWWLHIDVYGKTSTVIKMIFPLLMFTMDVNWINFHLLIYELNIVAMLYSLLLIYYHIPIVMKGGVAYEHDHNDGKYDEGWRANLKMILGERMHLAWLSPFIESVLPHDGVHWEEMLQQSVKNR